jgi:hypothetical protein
VVLEDPRGRGAGQAGAARPSAVDGRAVDQLGSGPGSPPSQLRILFAKPANGTSVRGCAARMRPWRTSSPSG